MEPRFNLSASSLEEGQMRAQMCIADAESTASFCDNAPHTVLESDFFPALCDLYQHIHKAGDALLGRRA